MQPIYGHTSPETAYMVNDYPYGSLRCRIRYWIEQTKAGYRFCSQTEHPRRLVWNAPKKSTYVRFAACMFLDELGHCTWSGITEYSDTEKVMRFVTDFPSADLSRLVDWTKMKAAYSSARAKGVIVVTINGEVKKDSEAEVSENTADAVMWKEIAEKIQALSPAGM